MGSVGLDAAGGTASDLGLTAALSGGAAHPDCLAQPRSLKSQPQEAMGESCETAKTALWTCRATLDSADQPATAGSFTDEQGTVGLGGGSKAVRFTRSGGIQSAAAAALVGTRAAMGALLRPRGQPRAGGWAP